LTRLPNPELIKKIKQITIKEIFKNGIENISMRKLAKNLKITPTTIYYYFKNKEELFEEIKRDGFDDLNRFVIGKINENDNYEEQLKCLINNFVKWILDNKNISELMFDKLPPNIEADDKNFLYYYELNLKAIDILKKGKNNKEFDFKDAYIEANIGFAMIYGITKLHFNKRLSSEFWDDISPLVERMIEMIFNSLKKRI
jgi:AcrR family transcriptional regulator